MSNELTGRHADEVAQPSGASVVNLRDKAGPLQRMVTGLAVSGKAGKALRELEAARVEAEVSIGKTAIALAATKIRTALVARSMPQIGALASALNSATSAVDMALTNGAAASVAAHLQNRADNRTVLASLEANGKLTTEEGQVLHGFLEEDLGEDVRRSRDRMADAKLAVKALHSHALGNIQAARVNADPTA